jgi:hypothetical protein
MITFPASRLNITNLLYDIFAQRLYVTLRSKLQTIFL